MTRDGAQVERDELDRLAALRRRPMQDSADALRAALESLRHRADSGRRVCWCPSDWDHGYHTRTCTLTQEAVAQYDSLRAALRAESVAAPAVDLTEKRKPLTEDEENFIRTYGVATFDARQVRALVPRLLATISAARLDKDGSR